MYRDSLIQPEKETLISFAVRYKCFSVVKYLTRQGANIHQRDENGDSLLHKASKSSEIIEFLLKKGVDPSITNKSEFNALETAVYDGNFAGFKAIFKKDSSLCEKRNCLYIIDIIHEIKDGHTQVMAYLAKKYEKKDFMYNKDYLLFLHNECADGNFRVVKKELRDIKSSFDNSDDFRSFLNKPNSEGQTLLHSACLNGNIKTLEFLLDNDANNYLEDSKGYTALELLLENNDIEQSKLLIKKIPPNKLNEPLFNGRTALELVNEYSNLELFVFLLKKGAYIDNSNPQNSIDNSSQLSFVEDKSELGFAKLKDSTTKSSEKKCKISFNETSEEKDFNKELSIKPKKDLN